MAAFLVAMVGCNKEPQVENGGISSDDKVYVSFSIQTLTTRSATDNDSGYGSSDATPDVEVGMESENTITSVDIVLRNDNNYVSTTVAPQMGENDQTWIATFNSSLLSLNTDYEVYIYANCSTKQSVDAVSDAGIGAITTENKFWMTNAYEPVKVNLKAFSTDKANPTDLGTHYVERSMARFDYMPKGPYTVGGNVEVALDKAALINQSKEFYMLRRVSDDGTTGMEPAPDHALNQYYVWQYCKENTIPGAVTNQQAGLSTGVVFRGQLTGGNVPENGTEPIYVFNNVLYGTWAQVEFYTDKFGESIDMASEHEALGQAGFTAYKPVDGKYYTYYYYWNRHNDNANNTTMGEMEFAVVRNNVYKLCVDSIKKFGHPDPTDPDPVDPTDPDETGEYYFKVTAKVLPWVVRVNHIEF